jgi:hypothetical protein
MKQSRQVNLYLTQEDIRKIQTYLATRKFLFVEDEILSAPQPIYLDYLFNFPHYARYLAFRDSDFMYRSFHVENQQKFRINALNTMAVEMNILGNKDDIFRVRFYYCPYYFENHEKKFKNPEFGVHVARFFRWLRRQYKRVPDMPTFYYNPDFAPKGWF